MTYEEIVREEFGKINYARCSLYTTINNTIDRITKRIWGDKVCFDHFGNLMYNGITIFKFNKYYDVNKYEIEYTVYLAQRHYKFTGVRSILEDGRSTDWILCYQLCADKRTKTVNAMEMMLIIKQAIEDFEKKMDKLWNLNNSVMKYIQVKEIGINDDEDEGCLL